MKIAVTYQDGQIFQHFGHTEQFKIYTVENNAIVSSEIVNTYGNGHGALAGFLAENKVNVVICGGIGGGAQSALSDQGILIFAGVSGEADQAVFDFILGALQYNPNAKCDHHHEEEHSCGSHTCH